LAASSEGHPTVVERLVAARAMVDSTTKVCTLSDLLLPCCCCCCCVTGVNDQARRHSCALDAVQHSLDTSRWIFIQSPRKLTRGVYLCTLNSVHFPLSSPAAARNQPPTCRVSERPLCCSGPTHRGPGQCRVHPIQGPDSACSRASHVWRIASL
jgi:hypothetical protein